MITLEFCLFYFSMAVVIANIAVWSWNIADKVLEEDC